MDEDRNLRNRLVVGAKRDGRREYDPQAREELVQLCMKPGVSIARTAMEFGLNPNLLRGWITRHQKVHAAVSSGESEFERSRIVPNDVALPATRTCAPEVPSPFVPVVQEPVTDGQAVCAHKLAITVGLHVRLPNGVEFDVANITIDELAAVVQMLGGDAVFRFDENLKIYLHRDPVDFRYGMNSLSILVEQSMRLNPMDKSLYIFGNRRRDRIKILGWDGSGFWLLLKRLETSHFIWPDNKADIVTMTTNVLHALLDGDDITAIRRHPKKEYLRVS